MFLQLLIYGLYMDKPVFVMFFEHGVVVNNIFVSKLNLN